jgi:hypothetical protein
VVIGAMPPVTDGAQVMRFVGVEVTVGSTLGTVAWAFGWSGEDVGVTLGTDGVVVNELPGIVK